MLVNIEDLRKRARRRLPRAVFDFIDGGAEDETSLQANRRGFSRYSLRPRVLVDVSQRDQSTTVLGQRLATPLILAPTGLCGMAAVRGELPVARAAQAKGAMYTLSAMAGVTIEEIARSVPGPKWFQLYVWRDRALTRTLVERAREAGYEALLLTVDTQVIGQRERDLRNGATVPPRLTVRNVLDTVRRVQWLRDLLAGPRPNFVNVANTAGGKGDRELTTIAQFVNTQFDPSVTWDDLDWLRSIWSGPLAIKGIMSAEDARLAVEHGVEAVIVSNHGGRQLDGLPGAVEVLSEVVDAVGEHAEVILDGGVRRGTDVVKAVALGAKACMIGRPYLYGLAAGGQWGVELALEILRKEIDRNLALVGCPRLADLNRSYLQVESPWLPD